MSEAVVEQPVETPQAFPAKADAVAETASDLMLKDQLKRLDKQALRQYLESFFGHTAEESVSKEDLAAAILQLNRDRIAQAQESTKEAAMSAVSENDPLVRVSFQNVESPGTDLEFSYGATPKAVDRKGKAKPGKIPTYHLIHNEEAEIPYSVYEHLRGLKVPEYKFATNDQGFIKGVSKGWAKRFALELILTDKQKRQLKIGS